MEFLYPVYHRPRGLSLPLDPPAAAATEKRQEMLASLKKGDKVVTVGGIHGEITEVHDDEVGLRIADKVEYPPLPLRGLAASRGRTELAG